jgi:histidine triad (HIT) family protein
MDCIFCKIINQEIPSHKVYEDDKVYAFLDIKPSAPGHTMVIPKKHVFNLFELSEQETGEFMEKVKKIALHIKESELKPTGLNIGVNQWRSAGQEVDHLHMHIIPRWDNDEGGAMQDIVSNPLKEDLKDILEKVNM